MDKILNRARNCFSFIQSTNLIVTANLDNIGSMQKEQKQVKLHSLWAVKKAWGNVATSYKDMYFYIANCP